MLMCSNCLFYFGALIELCFDDVIIFPHRRDLIILRRPCGNTTSSLLVPGWSHADSPLFLGCAVCCMLGTASLFFYRLPPPAGDGGGAGSGGRQNGDTAAGGGGSGGGFGWCQSLMRIANVSTSKDGVLLMLPLLFYSGVSNAFWSGM